MNDLKPCPFCGGEGDIIYRTLHVFVECVSCCGATMMLADSEKAISEWNARPEEDRLKAQNAELIQALERLASNEGFDCALPFVPEEVQMRIDFARKAISAARESHE